MSDNELDDLIDDVIREAQNRESAAEWGSGRDDLDKSREALEKHIAALRQQLDAYRTALAGALDVTPDYPDLLDPALTGEFVKMRLDGLRDVINDLKHTNALWEQNFETRRQQLDAAGGDAAFHPRAAKLMHKRKNFVVVAEDEPYFRQVYATIRAHEMDMDRWTGDDEKRFWVAVRKQKTDLAHAGKES